MMAAPAAAAEAVERADANSTPSSTGFDAARDDQKSSGRPRSPGPRLAKPRPLWKAAPKAIQGRRFQEESRTIKKTVERGWRKVTVNDSRFADFLSSLARVPALAPAGLGAGFFMAAVIRGRTKKKPPRQGLEVDGFLGSVLVSTPTVVPHPHTS